MDKKEQTRLRVQRYRERKNSVTEMPDNVTQYPAIIYALADPIKRRKLEKVYQSLRDFKQEKNVYYGLPCNGISFDIIGEMLEVTR